MSEVTKRDLCLGSKRMAPLYKNAWAAGSNIYRPIDEKLLQIGMIGADAPSELPSAGAYACGPVERGKTKPLGAALALKAAGTAFG